MYFPIIFFVAILLSTIGVGLTKSVGQKYNLLVHPQPDRWHKKPIAIHGGFGFFPVFLILVFFTTALYSPISDKTHLIAESGDFLYQHFTFLIALTGSSLILFIFGWLDDLLHFRAITKITVQLIVSLIFIIDAGTFRVSDYILINYLFTLFWFVGIINAINFIDCVDSLCSGTIIIICLSLLAILLLNNSDISELFFIINIIIILIGVLIGFIIFNFPPAKIFMGDSGSLSLGFIIAALALPSEFNNFYGNSEIYSLSVILIPISLLIYPIMDTSLVTMTRVIQNKKIYEGGKDHSSHRLISLGFKEKYSLLICCSCSVVGGISAMFISRFQDIGILIFSILALLMLLFGIYLGKYVFENNNA